MTESHKSIEKILGEFAEAERRHQPFPAYVGFCILRTSMQCFYPSLAEDELNNESPALTTVASPGEFSFALLCRLKVKREGNILDEQLVLSGVSELKAFESQVSDLKVSLAVIVMRAPGQEYLVLPFRDDDKDGHVTASLASPTVCRVLDPTPIGAVGSLRAVFVSLKVYVAPPRCPLGAELDAVRRAGSLSDVVVSVGGEDIPLNRAVLAARSPVFLKMFTTDCKESREGKVAIDDVPAELFNKFVEFLYSGDVADWSGCEADLLVLADRYMVDSLARVCERRLMTVDKGTVVALLRHAAEKPVIGKDLRRRVGQVLRESWAVVSATKEWADFEADYPVFADVLVGGFAPPE